MGVLEAQFATMSSRFSAQEAKMGSLVTTVANTQKNNWPMLISLAGIVLAMITGGWKLVELQNLVALAPLQAQSGISTAERAMNRQGLEEVQASLALEIGNRKSGFSALQQQLVENESQQRFHDSARAFQYQHLEGLIQMLYAKQGEPVPPSMTHQPSIGRDINIPIPNQ